jgi:predicted NBD/HSP70 family sugar kinase/transcriptional regulator with XRE-family HTH domain
MTTTRRTREGRCPGGHLSGPLAPKTGPNPEVADDASDVARPRRIVCSRAKADPSLGTLARQSAKGRRALILQKSGRADAIRLVSSLTADTECTGLEAQVPQAEWSKTMTRGNDEFDHNDSEEGHESEDLADFRAEILGTPAGRAAYQDSTRRNAMLATMAAKRKGQGLSQHSVAKAMGTTQSAVSQIESGHSDPQLRTLQKYARAINLRLEVAVVDDALPPYDEGMANGLWGVVERLALSPLLTRLATNSDANDRTLESLAIAARLPADLVVPILASLEHRGWVSSRQSGDTRIYDLRAAAAYTIGISVHRDKISGVLRDLRGGILEDWAAPIHTPTSGAVIEAVVDVGARLYECRGPREILGVGVSLAGVIDDGGTVAFAPDLVNTHDSWEGVRLEAEVEPVLQARVGDPHLLVAVENDANALAMREYLHSGERCVVAVLMSASGEGIGVGVVVEGTPIYGEDHAAGEGGHIIVAPNGEKCRSGQHCGCLETVASATSILRALNLEAKDFEGVREGLIVVNDRVKNEDAEAIRVLRDAGNELGTFLATAMVLYNPSRLVIFGHRELVDDRRESATRFRDAVTKGVRGGLSKGSLMLDRLHWQTLEDQTEADAAGAAALHYFLEHPVHWRPSVVAPGTLADART